MSKVLVAGATGKQGGATARLLLEHGHEVTAYVRDTNEPGAQKLATSGAHLAVGDLADGAALAKAAEGMDALYGLSVPFGAGGKDEEVKSGKLLVDTALKAGLHLVYSSIRGADRLVDSDVAHASSKQLIEAYLRSQTAVRATVLGPTYFMENMLNVGFNRLKDGVLAMPLSPAKKLDQTTVLDIAGMAVYAIEHPDEMIGKRVDLASDSVSGEQAAAVLSNILGRDIPYQQLPIEQVRQWSGNEVATMFEKFEQNTYYVDIPALHGQYPDVHWHDFEAWAKTIDWQQLLAGDKAAG